MLAYIPYMDPMGYMIIPFVHAIMMEHKHIFKAEIDPSSRTRWGSKVTAFQAPENPQAPKWWLSGFEKLDSPWLSYWKKPRHGDMFYRILSMRPIFPLLRKRSVTCGGLLGLNRPANWPIFCRDRTDIDASNKSNKRGPRSHRSWSFVERIIQFLWFEILTHSHVSGGKAVV
jgi:hypothetical protein